MIRHLTKKEVPDGSILGWVSDVHLGIENTSALKLMCEAWEAIGVTHIVAGGDIWDLHAISDHKKEAERILEAGTLLEESAAGRWFVDYLATRPCYLILGNHEDRLKRFYEEQGLPLYGDEVERFRHELRVPEAIEIIPNGGDLRLGNLNMSHLDGEFKKSTGGKYPAHRLLEMVPDFSSIGGHLHRQCVARRTALDENGIKRTRAAWIMGHMSREEMHRRYMSKHPGWQTGFGVISVHWEGNRPRWDVTQVEVMFDRKGLPYFYLWGRLFQ